jgi:MraZ protein
MRFLGNIEAKIDTKGRAFLPSVFRKQLMAASEGSLVLRRDSFQSCITVFPLSVWYEQMDMLRKRLNRWDARDQMIFREFVCEAEEVTLDSNGRLLISKKLLNKANITQAIRFIGMGDVIEIWSNDNGDQQFMDAEEFSKALQEAMAANGEKSQS